MEKDVLSQVIDAEKEIQKCLEAEKLKVREWLESEKKKSEEAFLVEQRNIENAQEQSLKEADGQAAAKAGAIESQSATAAEQLGHLTPEVLQSIIERRISCILPE